MTMCEPLPPNDLLPMELPLMLSREASPVRTFRLRAPKPGLTAIAAGCGLKLSDWLTSYDRASSSWRTSQTCLEALLTNQAHGLGRFSETWPNAGMMRSGKTYARPRLDCPTSDNERGWLPTPQKSDGMFLKIKRPLYFIGSAYRIKSNQNIDGNAKLADIALNLWGGSLSPTYVEAMMGYPLGWTNPE